METFVSMYSVSTSIQGCFSRTKGSLGFDFLFLLQNKNTHLKSADLRWPKLLTSAHCVVVCVIARKSSWLLWYKHCLAISKLVSILRGVPNSRRFKCYFRRWLFFHRNGAWTWCRLQQVDLHLLSCLLADAVWPWIGHNSCWTYSALPGKVSTTNGRLDYKNILQGTLELTSTP